MASKDPLVGIKKGEEEEEEGGELFSLLSKVIQSKGKAVVAGGFLEPGEIPLYQQLQNVGRPTTEPEFTAGGRFGRGVARGFLHPVRAFYDPEGLKDEEPGFAGIAGEFAGAALAFIPLYTGAGAVLGGTGILRSASILGARTRYLAPFGRSVASVRAGQAAVGATSFAGFETFAGESIEEAPARFLKGLAEGVIFEAAAMGVASAWRARPKKTPWKPSDPPLPTPVIHPNAAIDPLTLKLENFMGRNLGDTPELAAAKLRSIGEDPALRLEDSFLKILRDFFKGGQATLTGLTQRDVTRLFKVADVIGRGPEVTLREGGTLLRKNPSTLRLTMRQPQKGEDLFELLIVDTERFIWDVKKVGAGLPDFIKAIERDFPDLLVKFPKEIPPNKFYGKYSPEMLKLSGDQRPLIQVAKDTESFRITQGISTLVHELVHHVQHVVVGRRLPNISLIELADHPSQHVKLETLFSIISKKAPKGAILSESDFLINIVKQSTPGELRRQMGLMQREAIAQQYQVIFKLSGEQAVKEAEFATKLLPKYYNSDAELMSFSAELLLINPQKAREIAPLATKFLGGLIARESPNVRSMMTESAQTVGLMFEDMWRVIGFDEGLKVQSVFKRGAPKITPAIEKEWAKTGWFSGMRGIVEGLDVEVIKRLKDGAFKVRSLSTGATFVVDGSKVQRGLLQSIVKRDEEILRALDNAIDKVPEFMPVNLREFTKIGGGGDGVRKALVDVREYAIIDTSVGEWFRALPETIREQLIQKYGQLNIAELRDIRALDTSLGTKELSKADLILSDALELLGFKGLMRRDNGLFEIYVKDEATVLRSNILESPKFGAQIAGDIDSKVLIPSTEDWLKHALREQGVAEIDMDYFFKVAHNRLGERLQKLAGPEARQAQANVNAALDKLAIEPLGDIPMGAGASEAEQSLARIGIESRRLHDGSIELRDHRTKSILAKVPDDDYAAAYAKELTVDNSGPPLGDFPGGQGGNGGGASLPPKPQSQMFPSGPPMERGRLAGAETIFGSLFTALVNFAKNAENKGLGPVYTKVYLPLKEAAFKVNRELSVVKRDALGGLTFGDKMGELQKALVHTTKKRYPIITGHIEAITKQELEKAGGLMERAMTLGELRAARYIDGVGLGNDVARLQTTNTLVRSTLSGDLERTIKKLRQVVTSPEKEALLTRFEKMAAETDFATKEEVYEALALSAEEIQVVQIIRESITADKDLFSIYAVSRHAAAPKLKKGFKNGRDQYAFENKMTDRELLASRFSSETLEAGFLDSGLDPKRHLQGYWPHIRMWVQDGSMDLKEFLPPDVLEWVSLRYRSGELDVYDVDPLSGVYRHLRGLYMKRHFDPVMEGVNDVLEGLKDGRVQEVMKEYLAELMGTPHVSFKRLQGYINNVFKIVLGKDAPERLAHDIINGLSATASAAVLPFRMALIERNFAESFLKVPPRIGLGWYMKGLKYVVSQGSKEQAFKEALEAGAIRPGLQTLRSQHAAEELFGPAAARFKGGFEAVRVAQQKYHQIFAKGFEWYQGADDWGRAIAFHGQKLRLEHYHNEFRRGRITFEQFRSKSKMNTYDPLDVEVASKLLEAGDFDGAAAHLGRTLADETMTRYGYADHPVGWNSVTGRLFGQFGTWPVQYKDYLVQGVTRGGTRDRVEFALIHGATNGSIVAAGAAIGINTTNWTGFQFYTGGPYAELGIDIMKSLNGSDLEKRMARRNLYAQIPVLGWMETGNPRSIFLPGSYFLGDILKAKEALGKGDIFEGIMSGTGHRVMRPSERSFLEPLIGF